MLICLENGRKIFIILPNLTAKMNLSRSFLKRANRASKSDWRIVSDIIRSDGSFDVTDLEKNFKMPEFEKELRGR